MPWGRVDDTFHSHPKVTSIPAAIRMAAVGLHWMAISWCNAHTTDGKVPWHVVESLGGTAEQVAALLSARLWHRSGKCYRIHDFLDFNTSRAALNERHRQKAEAGRAGAAARWQTDSRPMAPAKALADGSDAPVPSRSSSRPVPLPERTNGEQQPKAVGAQEGAEDGSWFTAPPGAAVDLAGTGR